MRIPVFREILDPEIHHIHYFTKTSLQRLFHDEGFEILDIQTPFWEKTTDTYLEMKGYSHNMAVFLRYLVSPLRWIIKQASLGGTLSIVARKTVPSD